MSKYSGHAWIRVKRFEVDETQSWEERFRALQKHHETETTFLIEEVRKLGTVLEQVELVLTPLTEPYRQDEEIQGSLDEIIEVVLRTLE